MNSADDSSTWEPPPLTETEQAELELRWYQEKMLHHVELLLAFVVRHRIDILAEARGSIDDDALIAATKRVIIRRGSVHMASELLDQRHEIENECWYRGQRGEHDRPGIQMDWTERHAKPWRQWRVREYLFVADRCADRVVASLLAPPSGSASASV